ncbi:hypothetical protein GCM10010404_89270 [Nonomuraea africana]|uniref:Secreted protein n=1 Tax=Nonomuraea africana TaxID=46171 RepID=A0ABR9KAP4_9ACTN|nr:hypothetical protein [Nonomuraea africana]
MRSLRNTLTAAAIATVALGVPVTMSTQSASASATEGAAASAPILSETSHCDNSTSRSHCLRHKKANNKDGGYKSQVGKTYYDAKGCKHVITYDPGPAGNPMSKLVSCPPGVDTDPVNNNDPK